MKKLLTLLLLSPFVAGEEIVNNDSRLYTYFDEYKFDSLLKEIRYADSKKPTKDKWMKESEYQDIYNKYFDEYGAELLFSTYLGDIKVPCTSKREAICYDVEEEVLFVRPTLALHGSYNLVINNRVEKSKFMYAPKITAASYGGSSAIPVMTIDDDGYKSDSSPNR